MPELPEVETIVKALCHPADWIFKPDQAMADQPGIVGRKISNAEVKWARTIAAPDTAEFVRRIQGKKILAVIRRGKFIQIQMEDSTLAIHLRMSGDLRVELKGCPDRTHDRVVIDFDDSSRLVFNDTRKFGRIWLLADPESLLGKLGPEPFSADLTAPVFHQMLQSHKKAIKSLLLDQSFLAGLGNIYSDESLFRAGIHPLTRSDRLSVSQAKMLLEAVRSVLAEGIERNGSSIDWVYRGGSFQNHFQVYQRTGQPCLVCGTPIQRMVLGQRGTHYCPVCQPLQKEC